MPNVRLRTIINQDNSTTFQVQFHEGGEWEDLTWDMISDKPFETLDDTVFIVDENGVLTITDIPTVCSWGDVTDKPFIFLDPDDFTVSASGVLSYTGSMDWSNIIGKPFSTLDNNDFEVQNGQLSVRHQTIPNQTWSQIQNKPFTSLDPTNFQVVGGVLYLNLNPEIPTWSNVQNKPFTYLDSNDFAVVGDTLKVKHQTIPDPEWQDVQQKPFETLDANDFTVDAQGKASVNFPTPTPDDWDDVTGKPFETLNGTDFSVDADGEVSVNFPAPPTPTPDDWDDVTNKPFETLNSSDFSVDPDTGELSLAGGGGNPDWQDVQNKPFNYIGTGLYTYDGKLMNRYFTYIKKSMPQNYIANITVLKYFIQNMLRSALANRLNVAGSIVFDYYPLLLEGASNYMYLYLRIDNTQSGLTQFSDAYEVMVEAEFYRSQEGSSEDKFMIAYRVNGMPLLDSSNVAKKYMIEGIAQYRAAKTDGVYTSVNYDNTSMGMCSECNSFSISTGSVI